MRFPGSLLQKTVECYVPAAHQPGWRLDMNLKKDTLLQRNSLLIRKATSLSQDYQLHLMPVSAEKKDNKKIWGDTGHQNCEGRLSDSSFLAGKGN